MNVLETASMFDIASRPVSYRECRVGHINSTYFVTAEDGSEYVLQQINTAVFRDPSALMDNVFAVTDHIRAKLAAENGDTKRGTLHFRPLKTGEKYFSDGERAWRIYDFVGNALSLQAVEKPSQFTDVGKAFGHFQMQLSDFDASRLYETIPDFHDTRKRYGTFLRSLQSNPSGRVSSAENEIGFVKARKDVCSYIVDRIADGRLPLRVTHNDTKLNNVLMDEKTMKPLCVIDLDTIMPGSVLFDFGDAIRFGASTAAEDETDLSKVSMSLELFDAFACGFIGGLEGSLTENEVLALPMGALVITLETGMRFLTDYIDGDVYFRTSYPGHNLDRARNQFRLVADMEEKMPQMNEIIKKYI